MLLELLPNEPEGSKTEKGAGKAEANEIKIRYVLDLIKPSQQKALGE